MPSNIAVEELKSIQAQLIELRRTSLALESRFMAECDHFPTPQYNSARNLLHYLGVRQQDIRPLQKRLRQQGLSSLSAIEPCTLSNLNALLRCLEHLTGEPVEDQPTPIDFLSGPAVLSQNAERLLGSDHGQGARIMVTMPTTAADDPAMVKALLAAGMNVMRINCAHDDSQRWRAMVKNLRQAEQDLNKRCKVQMDLAGPKLRTGKLATTNQVLKLKPKRDDFGHVTSPALIWLTSSEAPCDPGKGISKVLQVTPTFLQQCRNSDVINFTDARDRRRHFKVIQVLDTGCVLSLKHTAYLTPETRLVLSRPTKTETRVANIPECTPTIDLVKGDILILTRHPIPGEPAQYDSEGEVMAPAHIHCTLPEAFYHAKPNDRVWLDDGHIGGVIERISTEAIHLSITHPAATSRKLRAEKGINFPDSVFPITALTSKDKLDLSTVVELADIVALSFVNKVSDVDSLHRELTAHKREDMSVVLKIESRQAFENLPRILLAALRYPRPVGVMVARGDLAVEIGFERLSEVQQEILWLCEAAHIPVIWATQILESMAKTGLPSRAEVSDAAMSVFAECAMLNKGAYIVETVQMLQNIILRMDAHYLKRQTTLRRLAVASVFQKQNEANI